MSVRDDIVRVLQSRGRVEAGKDEPSPDIINLAAAVRELQDAVVLLAERIDEDRAG